MNKKKLIELRCKAWGITEDEYYCNQCSDFSLEDMARAYRRGKNKGARDKAIQNVGFYQKQMQDIYDKKNKQIAELEKENAELKAKECFVGEHNRKLCEQQQKIEVLEAENAELESNFRVCEKNADTYYDQLTKAKDILQRLMENQPTPSSMYAEIDLVSWREVNKEAEQFLSEVEK